MALSIAQWSVGIRCSLRSVYLTSRFGVGFLSVFDDCIHFLSVVYLFVHYAVKFASPFLAYTGFTVHTANWSAVQRLLYNERFQECLTMSSWGRSCSECSS